MEEKPPWNSMEFHGIPWNSMKEKKTSMDFHGIPCPKPRQNSMEFHGKSSMEFHGKFSMEFHGTPWNSTEFHVPNPDRIPWSSMENFPWNSMEFHGIPWGYFTRELRCETNNNILLFYPFVQDANDSPKAGCMYNKILSNDNYICSLTATTCIACLTNWVSMTELNCTVQKKVLNLNHDKLIFIIAFKRINKKLNCFAYPRSARCRNVQSKIQI